MGKLVVISAPSGTGKNAIIRELLKLFSQTTRLVTTTTRDGFPGIYPTLINLASSPKTGGVALLDQAPVLAASANLVGQRSPLTLASRSMAGPSNSAWGFQNIGPEPPRADQKPCSNKIECLFTGLVR